MDFGLIHLALQLWGDGLVLQWEQELQAIIEPGAVNVKRDNEMHPLRCSNSWQDWVMQDWVTLRHPA